VGFAGSASGLVAFYSTLDAVKAITGAMLGMEPGEVNGEIPDAIGEITNMIAGSFRTKMATEGDAWPSRCRRSRWAAILHQAVSNGRRILRPSACERQRRLRRTDPDQATLVGDAPPAVARSIKPRRRPVSQGNTVEMPLPAEMPDADAPIADFASLDGDHSLAVLMLPAWRTASSSSRPTGRAADAVEPRGEGPVLAARVLGLANSAYSAPMQPITTVTEAVVRLGIAAVRNVVVTVCFASRMHDPAIYGSLGRDLVDHAIGTAYVARLLAEHARTNRDEAFLFGLVHDIGKLIILKLAHDHQKQHRTSIAPAIIDLAVVERHAAMGALALRRWKLPESLDEPIIPPRLSRPCSDARKPPSATRQPAGTPLRIRCSRSDVEILGDPVAAELQLDEAGCRNRRRARAW
jgi:hypothetical protein